jgi:hypothetical protein
MLRARRIAGAAYHSIFLRSLRGHPRIFCNSFQKSGTHLLVEMVARLPGVHNYERGAYWHSLSRAYVDAHSTSTLKGTIRELGRCLEGEVYQGHVEAAPEISEFLRTHNFKTLFLYRDPRDVVVSLFYWWQRYTDIDAWPYRYFCALRSDNERLKFLIEGWPDQPAMPDFPSQVDYSDIGSRFYEYQPWLDEPGCLSVRFESLRTPEIRDDVCRDIVRHLMNESSAASMDSMVQRMIAGSCPRRSLTFRRGHGGEWRHLFTQEHRDAFKCHAGSLLIHLGYEKDMDW